MSGLQNLIFDFGNVLFHLDLGATERQLRRLLGDDRFEAARAKLRAADVFNRYETGALSTEVFIEVLRRSSEPALTEAEVLEAWNAIFIGMPSEYFDLLERLRERYRVFLLSNINDLHARWIDRYMAEEHQRHDFRERYFDAVYYSHEVGLRKPDERIYAYVLQDAGLKPEETIFIDDLEANVRAAEALGIRGIVKTPDIDTAQLMRSFLTS
ncbi:MAG: HAD family phosphatase [Saprospiraceae bacterium]|nr:HAD family phosphatase [Saprospiraceae bacterium]MDW8228926.1 HAD family phosphatase [Saprospiraceae bacterium]